MHVQRFMLPSGEHITPKEAAKMLGCSTQTIRNLIDDGTLQGVREPRGKRSAYFIELAAIDSFVKRHGRYPEAAARPRSLTNIETAPRSRGRRPPTGATNASIVDSNAQTVLEQRVRELEQTTRVQNDTIRKLVQASEADARAHEHLRDAAAAQAEAKQHVRDALAGLSEHVGLDGIPPYPPYPPAVP